ncbi:MAG TPA: RNA polymerase sigma factor [Dissulfurispiraceae bacterium]|nr:RNA polymerase sigma factor [Dissulfurispiraceae bacterium]
MDEDIRLIEDHLSGRDGALDELVVKYQKMIFGLTYRMTHDVEDAKDLTQKTFLQAFRGLGNFRRDASFKTWLYQIAINTCISHVRKKGYDEREVDDTIAGEQQGALSELIEKEKKEYIKECLSSLPERQRAALVLRVYEGLSCAETASVMGCSEGAVKAHYHHAVKKLRNLFAEKGYEVRT